MIYKGQAYFTIELDTLISLSGASNPVINYRKPSGVTGEWTAVVSGTKLTYAVAEGDINQAGIWRLQGQCTISARTAFTDSVNLVVKNEYE